MPVPTTASEHPATWKFDYVMFHPETREDALGNMTDAGWRAVEVAKANGWWTILNSVEDLVVPDDLCAALDASSVARREWDGFTPSPKKAMLWWVKSAVKHETRATRVATIVAKAAKGERAR